MMLMMIFASQLVELLLFQLTTVVAVGAVMLLALTALVISFVATLSKPMTGGNQVEAALDFED